MIVVNAAYDPNLFILYQIINHKKKINNQRRQRRERRERRKRKQSVKAIRQRNSEKVRILHSSLTKKRNKKEEDGNGALEFAWVAVTVG